jgi:hypothetical protein
MQKREKKNRGMVACRKERGGEGTEAVFLPRAQTTTNNKKTNNTTTSRVSTDNNGWLFVSVYHAFFISPLSIIPLPLLHPSPLASFCELDFFPSTQCIRESTHGKNTKQAILHATHFSSRPFPSPCSPNCNVYFCLCHLYHCAFLLLSRRVFS